MKEIFFISNSKSVEIVTKTKKKYTGKITFTPTFTVAIIYSYVCYLEKGPVNLTHAVGAVVGFGTVY